MKKRRQRNRRDSRRKARGNRRAASCWNRSIGFEPLEPRMLLAVDLSGLDGSDGFMFNGDANFQELGSSVRGAGDFNGDGFDDVIIGAPLAGTNSPGQAYVLFGGASPFPVSFDQSALTGTNGFVIEGTTNNGRLGVSVSGAGDVNGDGLADLIVGAESAQPGGKVEAGEAYVIFGTQSPITSPLKPNQLTGTNGFVLTGIGVGDNTGSSVSSAGDVDGDGFDDVVIGARGASPGGNTEAGSAYVVFGKADGFAQTLALSVLDGPNGFAVHGIQGKTPTNFGDHLGESVAGAGDVNGDGFDDVILGAKYADRSIAQDDDAGRAYVIFGRGGFGPTFDLVSLSGINGVPLDGASAGDWTGADVSGAGDVNGDGFDDMIVGAPFAAPNSVFSAGITYVVYGKANFGTNVDLATLDGNDGTAIESIRQQDSSGRGVGGAGDVNGDGFDDVIIRSRHFQPVPFSPEDGYVVFGKEGGLGAQITLDTLNDTTTGLTLDGISSEEIFPTPETAALAGDVNGDGFDDFIVGAAGDDVGPFLGAGRAYIVFGGDFSNVVTDHAAPGGELIQGTAGADILIGNRGNDTAVGGGGQDVLRGGAGEDILEVGDLDFRRVVGGHGHDGLRLDVVGKTLDLTAKSDNWISGIEQIDITSESSSNGNTLLVDAQEVLRISGDRNLQDDANTLLVIGDSDDAIQLPPGWAKTVAGEQIGALFFDTYTSGGAAVIKVTSEMTVERLPFNGRIDVALVGNKINPTTTFVNPDTGESFVPASETWVDDWDWISVEFWVSNADASGVPIGGASFDVTFNPNYFAYDSVQYGPAFVEDNAPVVNPIAGTITGVSAVATRNDAGDDSAALLARVNFRPITDNDHPGVEHNADGQYVFSELDLDITVINPQITPFGGGDPVTPVPYQQPQTEVWPMIFDINDNGLVDFGDLSVLAAGFNDTIDDVPAPSPFFWQADFNHDGSADLGDLSWLATNFNKDPDDFILYPTNFPGAWQPSLRVASDLPAPSDGAATLTQPLLSAVVTEATDRIETALGNEAADALRDVTVEITDLAGDTLGSARGNVVLIDVDAAGYGWFVDATPEDDAEFVATVVPYQLQASESPAANRVDLLTVVMHELVHTLGYNDTNGDDLMGAFLPLATRRLLTTDLAFAEDNSEENADGSPSDTNALDGAFAGL